MNYKTLYYLLIVAVIFPSTIKAQGDLLVSKKVPNQNNNTSIIQQMIQDSTGLLWLVNPDKWYHSDGEKITATPLPFPSNDERAIRGIMDYTDEEGNFYLGGDSMRIFNPYTHKITSSIGLDESYNIEGKKLLIWLYVKATDGTIWAALNSHAIDEDGNLKPGNTILYSRNGSPFKKFLTPKFFIYSQNMAARGNYLFLGSRDTIFQYSTSGDLINVYPLPKQNAIPYFSKNQFEKDESILFSHYIKNKQTRKIERGIYELAPNTKELRSYHVPELNTIKFDRFNKVGNYYWLLGTEFSLHRYSLETRELIDYSKFILQQHPDLAYFGSVINSVYEDKTGSIWISTNLGWNLKVVNNHPPFARYLGERRQYQFCANNTCVIRGITSDGKDNIYIGYDFGVYKLNTITGKHEPMKLDLPVTLREVYSLTYFNDKLYLNDLEIDINTGKGKALLKGTDVGNRPHYLDKKNNRMWFSDSRWLESINIYEYDFDKNKIDTIGRLQQPDNAPSQVSQFHFSTTTNTLFLATIGNGVCEIDEEGNIIEYTTAEKSKNPSDSISLTYSIYEDDNQQLWIGHANGLSHLDLKTRDFTLQAAKGISFKSNRIFSIQKENSTYSWLGTGSGLYRLNTTTSKIQSFEMFPSQSGVEFNRFATHQSDDGTLYFGSVEGLFVFHPDDFIKASRINERFPIQLSRLTKFDTNKDTIVHTYENLSTISTIHLYPHHKYFSLEIFIPDFRDAEKNTYLWWLDGYETKWSAPTTNNTIRYDNLPPGKYTLYVKGGITEGYYETSTRQFTIIVHQAWYKTWWALCIYISLFFGLVYFIARYLLRQQLAKNEAKRLKELDVLKSRLYTNITHEFRTPLTVIMGMTGNIKGHSKEKELIQRNSKNLLQLINQLLDLSKLDAKTLSVENVQGNIVQYLQYLTESFYSMANEKEVRLTFYPEAKEVLMDYDESKIQHIIYNLLSNAIKFTQSGGKVILHLQQIEKQGTDWLQIKVNDTGVGISPANLSKIFDRFYQGDDSATRKISGTGIGLALTKELVEIMHGSITVESKLGEGTTFRVLLPIRCEKDTPKATTVSSTLLKEIATSEKNISLSSANKTDAPLLLLIEDNGDVVAYIKTLLSSKYNIEIARNGQEGINKALEVIPDIIISDVMMPEKDGFEVCNILKNDERTSHIPIILLTAKATIDARLEGLKGGADAYLTKPFHKEELFIRLEQLVHSRKKLQERYSNTKTFQKTESSSTPSLEDIFLNKLIKVVETRMDDPSLAVVHLCKAVNLSNTQVNRKLKALTGKTPSRFIRSIRLQKAVELLQTTDLNIAEIAYDVGFSDPNYFSRSFSEEFGHPPNVIRK